MKQITKILIFVFCLVIFVQIVFTTKATEQYPKKPSPDEILQMLKKGNERFYTGKATYPHTNAVRLEQAGKEDQGNHAYATIITCSDSRVPVELIFDAGVMDIFVIRVAGNVCDTDEIGSIEYGLAHVHTPVFVMLGHTQCGAVTAVTHALHGKGHALELNIPPLVDNIIGTGTVEWLPLEKVDEILKKVEASPDKETEPFASDCFSQMKGGNEAGSSTEKPQAVEILNTWQGDYPVKDLDKLPAGQRGSRVGYISDANIFASVWKLFKPEEAMPLVDFEHHLVVFSRNIRFYNRTRISKVHLKDDVLEVLAAETMSALPIEEKVAMSVAIVRREGIKAIQTGEHGNSGLVIE